MGGDRTNCPFDCGTPTAELLTIKLLPNSVISTPGAKFMTIDISNFYLNTPMDRYEYMRMKLDMFPDDVIEEYNLHDKVEPLAVTTEIGRASSLHCSDLHAPPLRN